MTGGTLPSGLFLDSIKGIIKGAPLAADDEKDIYITASSASSSTFTPVKCGPYRIKIFPNSALTFTKSGDKSDYRINETMNVTFKAGGSGLVGGYSAELDQSSNLPQGVYFVDNHDATWTLKGLLGVIGDNYYANVKIHEW